MYLHGIFDNLKTFLRIENRVSWKKIKNGNNAFWKVAHHISRLRLVLIEGGIRSLVKNKKFEQYGYEKLDTPQKCSEYATGPILLYCRWYLDYKRMWLELCSLPPKKFKIFWSGLVGGARQLPTSVNELKVKV